MTWTRFLILGCLLASFAGCSKCSRDTSTPDATTTTSAPTPTATPDLNKAPDYSGITVEQVITKDIQVGKGETVKEGSKVSGHYGMWVYAPAQLANKGKFVSGTPDDRKSLFTFQVGKGEVVKGWEQGVIGMKAGGKRSIIVPISLGYGAAGNDNVPPNSILLIEFEAVKVK